MQSLFSELKPTNNQHTMIQKEIVKGTLRARHTEQIPAIIAIIHKQTNNELRAKLKKLCEDFAFALLLRYAAANNCLELAQFILENIPVVNINARGTKSGKTALFVACEKGHLAMAQLFTKHGAYLNALDSAGACPASIALANHHWRVARHLAGAGALLLLVDCDQHLVAPNPNNFTPQEYQLILSVHQDLTSNNQRYGRNATHIKASLVGRYLFSRNEFQYVTGVKLADDVSVNRLHQTLTGALSPIASAFLEKWNIPTINRTTFKDLEKHYRGIPFARITDLLDCVFESNLPRISPIALSEMALFEKFVKSAETLDSTTSGNIFLKVAPNLGENVDDSAQIITWSLVIKRDQLTLENMKQLARQLKSQLKDYSCGHIIDLPDINKKMISVIETFAKQYSHKPKVM